MRLPIAAAVSLHGAFVLCLGGGASLAATTPHEIAYTRGDGALVVRRAGSVTRLAAQAQAPAWSPDGRRLAYVAPGRGGQTDVRVVDADGTHRGRLTRTAANEVAADWSPDGRRLVVERGARLFVVNADGRNERLLTAGSSPSWAAKGGRIAFVRNGSATANVYVIDANGHGLRRITTTDALDSEPAWSPDGRRVAFVSLTGDFSDLYVADVRTKAFLRLTQDAAVESSPVWSPDGRRVLYLGDAAGGGPLWSIPASGGAATPLGGPAAATRFRLHPAVSPELRPDFDQRTPSALSIQSSNGRYLLGFTSASDNVGLGPLSIIASRRSHAVPNMRAAQRVRVFPRGAKIYPGIGLLHFAVAFPHMHWHLMDFQRYELRRASDHVLVVRDRKSGFCLTDHWAQVRGVVPGKPRKPVFKSNCGQGEPGALAISEGTSVGYTDRYPAWFHGQSLDITHVPPGVYVLVHRTNPELALRELRYENNTASVLIRLTRPKGIPSVRVLARCPSSEWCPR
ncbi:MAG TPA: lysyl oxidase family protein [Gaiellaceae bacterium]